MYKLSTEEPCSLCPVVASLEIRGINVAFKRMIASCFSCYYHSSSMLGREILQKLICTIHLVSAFLCHYQPSTGHDQFVRHTHILHSIHEPFCDGRSCQGLTSHQYTHPVYHLAMLFPTSTFSVIMRGQQG
jgi:hypothetical protein